MCGIVSRKSPVASASSALETNINRLYVQGNTREVTGLVVVSPRGIVIVVRLPRLGIKVKSLAEISRGEIEK